MKKKPILLFLFIIFIIAVTIGTLQFIRSNNDHAECEETVEQLKDANGNVVTATKHICKERFPL